MISKMSVSKWLLRQQKQDKKSRKVLKMLRISLQYLLAKEALASLQ